MIDDVTTGPTIDTMDAVADDGVKRSTDGSEPEITLTHAGNEYEDVPVDKDHSIYGWSGQTLTRDDRGPEMMQCRRNDDVVTVYTDIKPADPQNLEYGGDNTVFPPASGEFSYVVEPGQDDDSLNGDMARSFLGAIGGVSGTFTCADDGANACVEIMTDTNVGGEIYITNAVTPLMGWTFESTDPVESVAIQDSDYMYFGYWLKSPVVPSDGPMDYEFDAISGGRTPFSVDGALSGNAEALTATYEGGAAGMYVTRFIQVKDQRANPQSPGYHGRFTAKAKLTAKFGTHDDLVDTNTTTNNTVEGSITDIVDGTRADLGFGVITLERAPIMGEGTMTGTTKAEFVETATNTDAMVTGNWSGQFYGPSAANLNAALMLENPDATDMAEVDSTLPTGVAGQFDVSSESGHARVVGAFAAEKTN